jgi:hypothetical protein
MFTNAKIIGKQVSTAEYLKQTAKRGEPGYVIGRSDLCDLLRCPNKWKNAPEDEENKAMAWGTLIDSMLLGGEMKGIVVAPQNYPADDKGKMKPWNWNANYCKDWKDRNKNNIIVDHDTHEQAQLAVALLRNDGVISSLIDASDYQVMVAADWKDSATEIVIPVKILVDIAPRKDSPYAKKLGDFKTTHDASPFMWGRTVFSGGYHVQAAFYLDIYNAATGEDRNGFLNVIQESTAPYQTARRWLSEEYIKIGRASYEKGLATLATCMKLNSWPGYNEEHEIDGWGVCNPEAWMILRAGVEVEPTDTTKNW